MPFDLGGSMVTGININALNQLRPALGLPGPGQVKDRVTQMAYTGADVEAKLGTDVVNVGPFPAACAGLARDVGHEEGHDRLIDEFGTPADVRDETRRHVDALAPGGGFIAAPIHVIQGGVPPENIIAWWETIKEYEL